MFVDVEEGTGNLDASLIEAKITPYTRAIVPVHLYGQMCDMRAIRDVADRHGLFVIEDAAHCVEGARDGIRPGELGHTACFSFYATKGITSGEGGAIVTDNRDLAERFGFLRLHGMTRNANDRYLHGYQHYDMTEMGWKYNMDNIQAAFLLPQLSRIESTWERRQKVSGLYQAALRGIQGLSCPKVVAGVRHAFHLLPIWVPGPVRDSVIQRLQKNGIGVGVNYRAIHLLSYFRKNFGFEPGDFPRAECIGDSTISIPFYPGLEDNQVEYVASSLARILERELSQSEELTG